MKAAVLTIFLAFASSVQLKKPSAIALDLDLDLAALDLDLVALDLDLVGLDFDFAVLVFKGKGRGGRRQYV
jgi:hypothetical protein